MAPSQPRPTDQGPWRRITRWRPEIPAWLISMVLHLVVLVVLGLTIRLAPKQAAGNERTADVGIVLRQEDGDQSYYLSQENAGGQSQAADAPATTSLAEALTMDSAVDPSSVLPKTAGVIGPAIVDGGVGHAADASQGLGGPGDTRGGVGRTSLYNIDAEGYKFVYVMDRSASMDGSGRSPLAAVKAELLASIAKLGKTHQFQIVFYNEQPWVFNPSGQAGKLAFADEQNKARARKFILSMTAEGGTRHEPALVAAIKLRPDVIFFLTDGDEPRLNPAQLEKIQRMAAGITINAIEFGYGPKPGSPSFLYKLASDNGGKYAYVDISKLNVPAARQP
jgi:hypothetical protein